jgi:hypothetical protein
VGRLLATLSFALMALACCCQSVSASAVESASLNARFVPERLGAGTAMSVGFQISAAPAPPPLTGMDVAYPANLGLATSGLGVATCTGAVIETLGPTGCPANSKMGSGTAVVEIPIGPTLVTENVALVVFAGPSPDGHLHLVVSASGEFPVLALVVLTGVVRAGKLSITVPAIPSLPEAPYVSVAQMRITLGGNLTYYETVDGASVAYRPAGVGLPGRCPHGGFAFAATFAFLNGSRSSARTAVPCPRHRRAA